MFRTRRGVTDAYRKLFEVFPSENKKRLIIVTDGAPSAGQDPCINSVMEEYKENHIEIKVLGKVYSKHPSGEFYFLKFVQNYGNFKKNVCLFLAHFEYFVLSVICFRFGERNCTTYWHLDASKDFR